MSEDSEIKDPPKKTQADWFVDWVIALDPPDSALVPREDVEKATGLKWDSKDMVFVLMSAKKKLYRATRFEWRMTEKGLYMLSPTERKDELYRRQREAQNRHRETLASSATIPVEKLSTQEKAEVEHARRMALHLYEEGKRASRRKWLTTESEEPKKIE